MEKIKFRAWNGSFIYGYFTIRADGELMFVKSRKCDGLITPQKRDVAIMQYTGVLDTGGNEIYEGDIIKVVFYNGSELRAKVSFMGSSFGFIDLGTNLFQPFSICHLTKFFIIGNIFEN